MLDAKWKGSPQRRILEQLSPCYFSNDGTVSCLWFKTQCTTENQYDFMFPPVEVPSVHTRSIQCSAMQFISSVYPSSFKVINPLKSLYTILHHYYILDVLVLCKCPSNGSIRQTTYKHPVSPCQFCMRKISFLQYPHMATSRFLVELLTYGLQHDMGDVVHSPANDFTLFHSSTGGSNMLLF